MTTRRVLVVGATADGCETHPTSAISRRLFAFLRVNESNCDLFPSVESESGQGGRRY